ncbi:MAG: helix-turn-helix domain-containing protein [Oscillospiraceae bacterium]|nr:helix-turn-helix domain-containing protein [Oscillospiraceae bacterium]
MSNLVSIDSKGYGKIYKAVMRDRELPILAKTIYAYFCAYAGCGVQAYPKRDKIVSDLQINKDTYTKHLGLLVERGYIAKERAATGNLYTILLSIPAYDASERAEAGNTDLLIFENAAAHGFGTIPKLVMLDQSLSPQAKAIYAYFASFAGAGTTAFPRHSTIMSELKIGSLGTYYRHFNQLVERGYLSVEQRKDNGRFDICIYRLAVAICTESVREVKPSVPKAAATPAMSEIPEHGGKPLMIPSPMSEKPLSEKVLSDKLEHQNPGHKNNNRRNIINSSLEKEQEYNHQPQGGSMPRRAYTPANVMDLIGYSQLRKDVDGWGHLLKDTLKQLQTPEEERRYCQTMDALLLELVGQLTAALNGTTNSGRLLAALQGQEFSAMIDGFLDRWREIRNVKAYVAASIKNLSR